MQQQTKKMKDFEKKYQDHNYIIVNPPMDEFEGTNIDLKNLPLVSFCIPTKNNEDTLEACLESIKAQNYPNTEIIIIDGNSTDKTISIAQEYADDIVFDAGTYGSACQTGLEVSSGEIIASLDSDIIIPHSNWLINAVKYFNYCNRVSSVWPLYVAPPNATPFARLYQTHLYMIFMNNRISKKIGYFGGGNTLFLRKSLEEIGGINREIHWGADFEWAKRLKDLNYKVVFIKDPLYHDTMRTFFQFLKKQFVGANTFVDSRFKIMGLSTTNILYEHLILGTKGMINGLLIERDYCWLYYPFLVASRFFAYGYIYFKKLFM